VKRPGDSQEQRSKHGLVRKLIANMATGVSKGFTRVLEINGVGYRAEVKGTNIKLSARYSHPIVYQLPPAVTAKIERQVIITLESADRQLLGTVRRRFAVASTRAVQRKRHQVLGRGLFRRKAGKAGRRSFSELNRYGFQSGNQPRDAAKPGAAQGARLRMRRRVSAFIGSLHHIYAQVISDDSGKTLAAASTLTPSCEARSRASAMRMQPRTSAGDRGESAWPAASKEVVFDRNGFLFHGRLKALADAARAAGLKF